MMSYWEDASRKIRFTIKGMEMEMGMGQVKDYGVSDESVFAQLYPIFGSI